MTRSRSNQPSFEGTFRWIPVAENGPTLPFGRPKMAAFAYVEPRRETEGALLIHGLPGPDEAGRVTASWTAGYAIPTALPGDVVTVVASQRPIATIDVTGACDTTQSDVREEIT